MTKYASATAVESAIKAAAKNAYKVDPSVSVQERIRRAHFDRFLSRVFSEGEASEWVLKGGTGILARVPTGRSTQDVDLYRQGHSLDDSITELVRLASIDLGDHFRFTLKSQRQTLADENQPYAEGSRVEFDTFLGVKQLNPLRVDLVSGAGVTAPVKSDRPTGALRFDGLQTNPYRLYPVVDQMADKIAATVSTYSGKPSSRVKDLVDLVILTVTQRFDAASLRVAVTTEFARRRLPLITTFTPPPEWSKKYEALARNIPECAEHRTFATAEALIASVVAFALDLENSHRQWSPSLRSWE